MTRSEAMARIIAADLDFPGSQLEGLHDRLDAKDDEAFWKWWHSYPPEHSFPPLPAQPKKTDEYTDGPAL